VNLIKKLSKRRSRQGLYEFLEREFINIRADAKVLTVGSGGKINQILYKFASINRFDVVSLDIDSARNPDIIGDVCTYQLDPESFDTVVICEVLEHVHSPHIALKNLFNALKPGGNIILSTPFMLPIHEAPRDYFRYTRYGLEFLLKDFENVIITTRNSYFEAIDVLWMRTAQSSSYNTRALSYIAVPIVYFIYRPFTLFYSLIANNDDMTTGYTVTATKAMDQKDT
jgi:SAM-dependent methyltransferase